MMLLPFRAVDNNETPTRAKRLRQMTQYRLACGQFVIRVRNENGINFSCGQVGIIRISEDDLDIVLALQQRSDVQEEQRESPEIDRDDFPSCAGHIRKFQCEISGARAEIDDNAAVFEIKTPDYVIRTLPLISVGLDGGQGLERSNALKGEAGQADEEKKT